MYLKIALPLAAVVFGVIALVLWLVPEHYQPIALSLSLSAIAVLSMVGTSAWLNYKSDKRQYERELERQKDT